MKKLRVIRVITIIIILLNININFSNAEGELPKNVEQAVEGFVTNINKADPATYYYIDTTNTDLYNNVQKYLHNIKIEYQIKEFEEKNEEYVVKIKVTAEGQNWKNKNRNAELRLKNSELGYIVTQTTLFNEIGPENVTNIWKIAGIVLLVLILVGVAVTIIVIKKKRSNKPEKEEK